MARTRQVYPRVVLDPIPTHDGTPAVAIYRVQSDTPSSIDGAKLPLFSFQLYDVSPHTASKVHAMSVAVLIHEGTIRRRSEDHQYPQRIDVYSFPLPAVMSQEERVAKCIAHQRAELAARMETGKPDFFMQGTFSKQDYQRDLFMIDSSVEKLEENGFLAIAYDQKVPNEERDEDDQLPEISVTRFKDMSAWFLNPADAAKSINGRPPVMEVLGLLMSQTSRLQSFYGWYVEEGIIYEDLKKAKRNK